MPDDDPVARRLLALTPAASDASRDALMFEAGRRTGRRVARPWKAACGLLALAQSATLLSLALPSPAPNGMPPVAEVHPFERPALALTPSPRPGGLSPLSPDLPPLDAAALSPIDPEPLRASSPLPSL